MHPRLRSSLFLLVCSLTGPATACSLPETLVGAHVNPGLLNESARLCLQQGDRTTAEILLERAARLAPADPRIAANLAALRAGGHPVKRPAGTRP